MSWFNEKSDYTFIQKTCMRLLSKGVIPDHVAIIMDGNRRYAKKNSLDKVDGHRFGFDKLTETLKWCRDLNIKEVSVFAFSINNYKRENNEVTYLMDMMREKFQKLLEEMDVLEKYNVCIRVIGNLSLLPKDIQDIAKQIMKSTSKFNRFCLNICLSYTSHDEIRHSLNHIRWGIDNNLLQEEDISEDLINKCMYMRFSPKVSLMIRTSGEARLSDFLMWQTDDTCIKFYDEYWPEFSIWNLFSAIFKYQTYYLLNRYHGNISSSSDIISKNERVDSRTSEFLLSVENKYHNWLYNGEEGYFF